MRIATPTQYLDVAPGATTSVVVDVVNTADVIDGISARVIGLPDESVSAQPPMLSLFPETSGQVTVTLTIPNSQPAGHHPITVEMVSHGAQLPPQYLDLNLDVAPHPGIRVAAAPQLIRARRGGRFVLELTNEGNVALDVVLNAVDVERRVSAAFTPSTLTIAPGSVYPVMLDVRGPRMISGAEVERAVAVEVVASEPHGGHDARPAPEPLRRTIGIRLRQRPLFGRGLLTALVLVGIVGLWAAAFLLGITKVFGTDAGTKAAPASFFAATRLAGTTQNVTAGDAGQLGPDGSTASGFGNNAPDPTDATVPSDALSKTGELPPGLGGQITGTVKAKSSQQPVGRILVKAWRKAYRNGRTTFVQVSSAATQSDGTYVLAGLFPTSYYLQFSAAGFHPIWYPGAPGRAGAKNVDVGAQGIVSDIDTVITGRNAIITGKVDAGTTKNAAATVVTARALTGTTTHVAAATAHTTGGTYRLTGLPAPGSYELTFATPGYQNSTLVDNVDAGENRIEPKIPLGAAGGTIGGLVTSGGRPLPGVTVSVSVGGTPVTTTTPTTGQIGRYFFSNLKTPATYVITFSEAGYGRSSKVVNLGPGKSKTNVDVQLGSGTGTVTGVVTARDGGARLGGVTVTVGGTSASAASSTTTLTAGNVGSYLISGLATPGTYTLTFTRDGYAPATVSVTAGSTGGASPVDVKLTSVLGSISGRVTLAGNGYPGATITATNGTQSRTTTSGSQGSSRGSYLLTGLTPGTYSVTATMDGLRQQTRIVTVVAAKTQVGQNLALRKPASR